MTEDELTAIEARVRVHRRDGVTTWADDDVDTLLAEVRRLHKEERRVEMMLRDSWETPA